MPYDLSNFDLAAMLQCSLELRKEIGGAVSTEDAAQRVVQFLRENCREDGSGRESNALVRFYRTVSFEDMEAGVQQLSG